MQLIPAKPALVCDGLFERHPKLRGHREPAGYVRYLMDRLDEKYERFKNQLFIAPAQ